MVKSKSKFHKRIMIAVAILVALIIVGRVSAMSNDMRRIETTEQPKTTNVSSEKKEAVKTAENASVEKPAEPVVETPAPAPVDPNGCEAKGMYWRADNYECIAKPGINENIPGPTTAATPVTTQSSAPAVSGDCSLVYSYPWPTATAYRVCMQESGGNSHNSNWSDNHMSWAGCMGSFGLFQINCSHGQVYDGAQNVAIAYQMWSAAGGSFWQDWPNTCRKVGC